MDKKFITFIIGISSITIIPLTLMILNEKSPHEKRMELIEEKKELLKLQQDIETKKTEKWVDSMKVVVNRELNKTKK